MSCRRISRELVERFRFGEELDLRSDPHLAHLQTCAACREEVGLDRALVFQLRRALAARVAGSAPSANSWEVVRARALEAGSGRSFFSLFTRLLRLAPAAVAVGVMVFAVSVTRDAELPTAFHSNSLERYQTLANAAPAWQPPWYLRYRTADPVLPSRGGLLASAFPVTAQPAPPPAYGLLE
jgi:anti-sigma factor RsiW